MSDFMKLDLSKLSAKGILASFVLLLTGVVFTIYSQFAGSQPAGPDGIYLKCSDPSCDYTEKISFDKKTEMASGQLEKYQTEHPQYLQEVLQSLSQGGAGPRAIEERPMGISEQSLIGLWGNPDYGLPFTCPKCSRESVYLAYRCEKCGEIFFTSPTLGAQGDKCPKCGFSKTEQKSKEYQEKKKKQAQ